MTDCHIPYGWRIADDGTLQTCLAEQALLAWVHSARKVGMTDERIVVELNALGVYSRTATWTVDELNKALDGAVLPRGCV